MHVRTAQALDTPDRPSTCPRALRVVGRGRSFDHKNKLAQPCMSALPSRLGLLVFLACLLQRTRPGLPAGWPTRTWNHHRERLTATNSSDSPNTQDRHGFPVVHLGLEAALGPLGLDVLRSLGEGADVPRATEGEDAAENEARRREGRPFGGGRLDGRIPWWRRGGGDGSHGRGGSSLYLIRGPGIRVGRRRREDSGHGGGKWLVGGGGPAVACAFRDKPRTAPRLPSRHNKLTRRRRRHDHLGFLPLPLTCRVLPSILPSSRLGGALKEARGSTTGDTSAWIRGLAILSLLDRTPADPK